VAGPEGAGGMKRTDEEDDGEILEEDGRRPGARGIDLLAAENAHTGLVAAAPGAALLAAP